jgi:hypothetical protein
MIGNVGYAVHLRLDLSSHSGEGTNNLCLRPGTLQPEIQTLLDVAGPLVGVGIKEDIDKFNDMLKLVFGKRLIFGDAIDAAVIAHLSGVNISKHSVQALVLLCLGGHLPKDRASVGDNTWDFPFEELPQALQLYIRGDTTQLGLAVWILLCCWVAHMFPDLHAVFKVSKA